MENYEDMRKLWLLDQVYMYKEAAEEAMRLEACAEAEYVLNSYRREVKKKTKHHKRKHYKADK